ncbi:TPA: class I SAM-dependent methyltransferase [Campylobacter upsaliensis]|nr:class I SAM-dependent methyltransferase [Campylobacter upsaliensis]
MQNSLSAYTKKYDDLNYGLSFADGHIVRFYERILKYKLDFKAGNMLDFGCGNGVHSAYFKSKGYKCFGVDIVPSLKQAYEKLVGGGGCKIIQPNASLAGLFEEKMNLILANQSLYYLPKNTLAQNMDEFYEMSEKGAIFFATMMSEKNYYFKHAGKEDEQGLRKVVLEGRLNETSYIHFVKNATDLKELFKPFKCLYLGEYDPINFYEFEGSAHHFIYVGVKE